MSVWHKGLSWVCGLAPSSSRVCFHAFPWLSVQHSALYPRSVSALCPVGGPCSTASRRLCPSFLCPACQTQFGG